MFKLSTTNRLKLKCITVLIVYSTILTSIYVKIFMFTENLLKETRMVLFVTLGFCVLWLIVAILTFSLYKVELQYRREADKHYVSILEYTQVLINVYSVLNSHDIDKAKKILEANSISKGKCEKSQFLT